MDRLAVRTTSKLPFEDLDLVPNIQSVVFRRVWLRKWIRRFILLAEILIVAGLIWGGWKLYKIVGI